ncbi:MAG: 4'-phosphopantetheinyl transferase family protein [Oscillochloridaceae bacterium umkhey_bin13]
MIAWLVQSSADLPTWPAETWLSPPELARLGELRVVKRRDDWLLGRWTAKRLAQQVLGGTENPPALSQFTIHPAADGAPELWREGQPVPRSISISHSHGQALCALGVEGSRVGADIERVNLQAPDFLRDYLTTAEHTLLASASPAARPTLAIAIWSAKEAVLKALRLGLTVDTLRLSCLVPLDPNANQTWVPFTVDCDPQLCAAAITGWWRLDDPFVMTLAVIESPLR